MPYHSRKYLGPASGEGGYDFWGVPGESPILFIPKDLILVNLVMNEDVLSM